MILTNFEQVKEAKYLSVENSWRYRGIMRCFFVNSERMNYWLYKEDIFNAIKDNEVFNEYTIDQLKADLDSLVDWGNIIPIQDSKKAKTIEEYRNKQFRYHISDIGVEIERMTIRIENLKMEASNLEANLLLRFINTISKIHQVEEFKNQELNSWWDDLSSDFKRLNDNYQDYIRSLVGINGENMMNTLYFLEMKDKIIDYLRNFVKQLHKHTITIEEILKSIDEHKIIRILDRIVKYRIEDIPRMGEDIHYDSLKENIYGKYKSMNRWFLGGDGQESEANKLFDMTNDIIRKITRYAWQIADRYNSGLNRKQEYNHLAKLFAQLDDVTKCHELSSYVFGVPHGKYLKGNILRETDSYSSSVFEEAPLIVELKPRTRTYRERVDKTPIVDKTSEKREIIKKEIEKRKNQMKIIDNYIVDGKLSFKDLPCISPDTRNILLRWLTKGMQNNNMVSKTEDGRRFKIVKSSNNTIVLKCEDGELKMPEFTILFI